jgi:nucleotide-binding universal stress UspA family protein
LHKLKMANDEVAIEYRMTKGVAAEEILRLAKETACDLIVMGTHGRTGLGRVLVGSVAEQIMRNALCPVLAVKSPAQLNQGRPQKA